MEGPAQSAGTHIKSANVARGRGMGFRILSAHDNQILVDRSRRSELDGLLLIRLAQAFAQIDLPFSPRLGIGLPVDASSAYEIIAKGGEDAALMAVGPVGDAARAGPATVCRSNFQSSLPVAASRAMTLGSGCGCRERCPRQWGSPQDRRRPFSRVVLPCDGQVSSHCRD